MNWKRYQNELIVLAAFLFMLIAYANKYRQVSNQTKDAVEVKHTLGELKEVIALKKIWTDKDIKKSINKIQASVPAPKVQWNQKGKKITASYKNLSANELNKLITNILSTPVEVTLLDIKKVGSNYNMEFRCKW